MKKHLILFLALLLLSPAAKAQKTAILFADSEMKRFPEAWQLDHGKRLYFGYSQGLGCLAMLKVWKATHNKKYLNYVVSWADSIINDKGKIHLYEPETYNIDYVNSGKILFDVYKETGNNKYKLAMDVLVKQMKNQPKAFLIIENRLRRSLFS